MYVADAGNDAVKAIPAGCTSASCVTLLGGDWSERSFSPNGVAVDGSGNIYTAGHDGVFEMPPGCTSFACVTEVGGDEDNFGIAVDAAGNIYSEFNHVVNQEILSSPPNMNFFTDVGGVNGLSLMLRNIGNTPLTFPVPSSGENPSVPASFTLQEGTTCPEITPSSSAGTLAAGANCELYVAFVPETVGQISGSLVLTDNNLYVTYATQSVALSGIADPGYGYPFVKLTPSPSNITTTQPLSVTVTVNWYSGYPTPTGSVTLSSGSYTSASTTLTAGSAIINIPAGQLAVGDDTLTATYTPDSSSSSLYAGTTGSSTVTVMFVSVWIVDGTGGTSQLNGSGTGMTSSADPGENLALAVDSSSNVWTIGSGTPPLEQTNASGTLVNQIAANTGGLVSPTAIAIDGASHVWTANGNNSVSLFANSGSPLSPSSGFKASGLSTPAGIAIDLSGSVWIANKGNNSVTRILGAAGPVAPLATAVANNITGAKP